MVCVVITLVQYFATDFNFLNKILQIISGAHVPSKLESLKANRIVC